MTDLVAPVALTPTVGLLRSGLLDLASHVAERLDRIDDIDRTVHAILPEDGRSRRLSAGVADLLATYPTLDRRPALFGALVGIKDIISVDGLPTRLGSAVPSGLLADAEAIAVQRLKNAGALVVGKTVTTEFAGSDPAATTNPHDPRHTPGGSSSGSAAAVAAGLVDLALGSQTVGSVIRPAAYCGVVGFKPSRGRIPIDGMLDFSRSADHIGTFTSDVAGAALAASVLCIDWEIVPANRQRPVLAIPEGAYLDQAGAAALESFNGTVRALKDAGYEVIRAKGVHDLESIRARHNALIAGEFHERHEGWFFAYGSMYRANSVMLFHRGAVVTADELAAARGSMVSTRLRVERQMEDEGIDLWIAPSATSSAPRGLAITGDPAMNLLWTHTGQPALTIPSDRAGALPLGLQIVGRTGTDEQLLAWAERIEEDLS